MIFDEARQDNLSYSARATIPSAGKGGGGVQGFGFEISTFIVLRIKALLLFSFLSFHLLVMTNTTGKRLSISLKNIKVH